MKKIGEGEDGKCYFDGKNVYKVCHTKRKFLNEKKIVEKFCCLPGSKFHLVETSFTDDGVIVMPYYLQESNELPIDRHDIESAAIWLLNNTGWLHIDIKKKNVFYDKNQKKWLLGDFGKCQNILDRQNFASLGDCKVKYYNAIEYIKKLVDDL